MSQATIRYHILTGFHDPQISADVWNSLLEKSSSDVIFMTWQWQKTWWDIYGEGKLLLIMAESDGKPLAIAPLFANNGMMYFVGSGASDYLDFIGDVHDPRILERLIIVAREQVPDFQGIVFYHVPEQSVTHENITIIAERQHWKCFDQGSHISPMIEQKVSAERAYMNTQKNSLLRHEAWFKHHGGIEVQHLTKAEEILPHLDDFFKQHIERWNATTHPSLFLIASHRRFYHRLSEEASATGWLRFTRIIWQGSSIAFHFGFNYHGNFLWYKPSFDISLAKYSPGEVLLRQLLLKALQEEAIIFDFGIGDEPFKKRFATNNRFVCNRGLYPVN